MTGLVCFLVACQGVSAGPSIAQSPQGGSGTLSLNNGTLNFGSVTVGNTATLSFVATNSGPASVTVSSVSISTQFFKLVAPSLPVIVASGASTTVTVSFTPNAPGAFNATATITSDASNATANVALTGTGVSASQAGQLSVSPATMNLGSIVAGLSGTGSGTLSATGASVTVTGASSDNPIFVVSGLTFPVTIAAGQSVPFTVTFSPTAAGTVNATLTFTASNAQTPTTTEALTGTATAAPVHSVNLSWTGSTSTNISGYNIYRALYSPAPVSACGGFARINTQLNTGLLYTDNNVVDGSAYCYAATAVNTSNQESAYSNIVSNVQIPGP